MIDEDRTKQDSGKVGNEEPKNEVFDILNDFVHNDNFKTIKKSIKKE